MYVCVPFFISLLCPYLFRGFVLSFSISFCVSLYVYIVMPFVRSFFLYLFRSFVSVVRFFLQLGIYLVSLCH